MRFLISLCCVVFFSTPAFGGDVAGQFTVFCEEWMGKLAARERHNVSHIKWDTKAEGVMGEYVGYTQEHTCTLKDTAKVPVGKIIYREIVYQKRGNSIPDAEKSTAQAIETTEVTEIFRYGGGKWVY